MPIGKILAAILYPFAASRAERARLNKAFENARIDEQNRVTSIATADVARRREAMEVSRSLRPGSLDYLDGTPEAPIARRVDLVETGRAPLIVLGSHAQMKHGGRAAAIGIAETIMHLVQCFNAKEGEPQIDVTIPAHVWDAMLSSIRRSYPDLMAVAEANALIENRDAGAMRLAGVTFHRRMEKAT